MNRSRAEAAFLLGLTIVVSALSFGGARATPVAESSPPSATPATEQGSSPYLAGDALPLLLPSRADTLDVVAVGSPLGWVVPIVVHNGTDASVVLSNVSGTAHDADGSLLATGESGSSLGPIVVPPDQAAIALVYFNSLEELADDAVLAFELDAEPEASAVNFRQDLEIVEASLGKGGITGLVRNGSATPLVGRVGVVGVCVNASGAIVGAYDAYADKNDLGAGDTATFDAPLYGPGPCHAFLVAASGYVES